MGAGVPGQQSDGITEGWTQMPDMQQTYVGSAPAPVHQPPTFAAVTADQPRCQHCGMDYAMVDDGSTATEEDARYEPDPELNGLPAADAQELSLFKYRNAKGNWRAQSNRKPRHTRKFQKRFSRPPQRRHFAAFARKNPRGKDGRIMTCRGCGADDHFVRDCPSASSGAGSSAVTHGFMSEAGPLAGIITRPSGLSTQLPQPPLSPVCCLRW